MRDLQERWSPATLCDIEGRLNILTLLDWQAKRLLYSFA